ncbi:MAG: AI-2E family transporter [Oscillospiraceae bacterium]|nr:AI-2E family transporter [Oscillospiraceae bacterium]
MEINKKAFRNLFIAIAACIVLYWMLHDSDRVRSIWNTVSGMFSPFVLGAAVAFILNVPMRSIEGMLKGINNISLRRTIALVLTIIAFVLVVTLVFWLLIPQIGETIQSLIPKISAFFINLGTNIQSFLNENPKLMEYVMEYTDFENLDWPTLIEKAMTFLGDSVSTIANGAFSAIGSVTGAIVEAVIGIVFAIYCLFRKEILSRQGRRILYSFLPEHTCDEIIRILRLTNSTFSNFLSGQCVEVLILGCMFAISMAIFRMPYIPLVSVLVAVTAFIPVVGAFVGCIFGAFFILVNNPIQAVWFVVMFLILQQIENNVIYPRVVGTSIGLPGMWVLVAVTVGGDLMGVGGMFLMIPFASVLYTLMREITDRRLNARGIDPEKLQDHLPELTSKFKKKRENARKKASGEKSETENEAE